MKAEKEAKNVKITSFERELLTDTFDENFLVYRRLRTSSCQRSFTTFKARQPSTQPREQALTLTGNQINHRLIHRQSRFTLGGFGSMRMSLAAWRSTGRNLVAYLNERGPI